MNGEEVRIWKYVVVAYFKILIWNLSGGIDENLFQVRTRKPTNTLNLNLDVFICCIDHSFIQVLVSKFWYDIFKFIYLFIPAGNQTVS